MIKVYFDGACSPNPGGIVSYGALIYRHEKIIYTISKKANITSEKSTNNSAEYCGCIAAMRYLLSKKYQDEEIYFFGDSQLVINQMSNKWEIGNGVYTEFAIMAQFEKQLFKNIKFEWIPREKNTEADLLARNANGL